MCLTALVLSASDVVVSGCPSDYRYWCCHLVCSEAPCFGDDGGMSHHAALGLSVAAIEDESGCESTSLHTN